MVRQGIILAGVTIAVALVVFLVRGAGEVTSSPSTTRPRMATATLPTELIERLCSVDKQIRYKALVELSRQQRQPGHQLAPDDVFRVFSNTLAIDDPIYVAQASHLLARYPKNANAIALAKQIVAGDQEHSAIVGSLMYLKKHDAAAFAEYFTKREYVDLPFPVREQLAATKAVSALRAKYHAQLTNDYLNWQPPKYSADVPNPYRQKVVAEGKDIVRALIKARGKATRVSSRIVRALGEIGAPDGFVFLFEAYKNDPRQDIAVAIGSSWRSLYVDKVFKSLDEPALRKLLGVILGQRWGSVKNRDTTELQKYVIEHLVEIIKDCRRRSKGFLG